MPLLTGIFFSYISRYKTVVLKWKLLIIEGFLPLHNTGLKQVSIILLEFRGSLCYEKGILRMFYILQSIELNYKLNKTIMCALVTQ